MDETCPVSTEGWTRRVHFVREGRGGGALIAIGSPGFRSARMRSTCPGGVEATVGSAVGGTVGGEGGRMRSTCPAAPRRAQRAGRGGGSRGGGAGRARDLVLEAFRLVMHGREVCPRGLPALAGLVRGEGRGVSD